MKISKEISFEDNLKPNYKWLLRNFPERVTFTIVSLFLSTSRSANIKQIIFMAEK